MGPLYWSALRQDSGGPVATCHDKSQAEGAGTPSASAGAH